MLRMTEEAEPGVALMDDPTLEPVLALGGTTNDQVETDKSASAWLWEDPVETSPVIVFDARDPDEEEDEEEEEDEDFFDDEEEEEDDLDDDLEEDDFEEEEFEEDEEEEEEDDDEEL
jgi:hypothetical protein